MANFSSTKNYNIHRYAAKHKRIRDGNIGNLKGSSKIKKNILEKKITKPFSLFVYSLIFIFCSRLTDRLTDKVNYMPDAHWYRESLQKINSLS